MVTADRPVHAGQQRAKEPDGPPWTRTEMYEYLLAQHVANVKDVITYLMIHTTWN